MSKYTTEVRFICENAAGLTESKGFNDVESIIEASRTKIFNFIYPIYDPMYKPVLESKILRHFYTREISEETVGLWKLRLSDKLNIIMPYYNQLYKSALLEYNPLWTIDLTTEHKRTNTGTNQTTGTNNMTGKDTIDKSHGSNTSTHDTETLKGSTTNSIDQTTTDNGSSDANGTTTSTDHNTNTQNKTGWNLYSDTPQGGIDVITNDEDGVARNTYLTNVTKTTDNATTTIDTTASNTNNAHQSAENESKTVGNNTSNVDDTKTNTLTTDINGSENTDFNTQRYDSKNETTNINNTEDYVEHVFGTDSAYMLSTILLEYRKTLINIDNMILNELEDLFFGLW